MMYSVQTIQPSQYISTSQIMCQSPPSLTVTQVHIAVSTSMNPDSNLFRQTDLGPHNYFQYDQEIEIVQIIPASGPENHHFNVNVLGGPFLQNGHFLCRFGDTSVQGRFINEGKIECMAPKHTEGFYPFELTQNGEDFTNSRMQFQFYKNIQISHIIPFAGPSVSAGTVVNIFGDAFINSTQTLCRFKDIEVPALYLNKKRITCETPQLSSIGTDLFWLGLHTQLSHQMQTPGTSTHQLYPRSHHFPLYLGYPINVEVTNNAQDYTNSGTTFLYQEDISIKQLFNGNGPSAGGTPIFITGTGFVNSTDLKCRIGYKVVRAVFLTREAVLCFSPPQRPMEPLHRHFQYGNPRSRGQVLHAHESLLRLQSTPPNLVYVEMTNNGIDFSNFRHFFDYSTNFSRGTYQPGVEENTNLECPRGSFCRYGGQSNFTLCPKGTYQPLKGQSSCLRCPIGYMCPENGLLVPCVCPSGFVCDVTGIESDPNPCPEGHFCLEGTATSSTTCSPFLSKELYPLPSLTKPSATIFDGKEEEPAMLILGGRNSACWNNSTDDIGLQASELPTRFWAQRHILPLDHISALAPFRGRFCLDDSCIRLEDRNEINVFDSFFDYSSTEFALRRPVPCPKGMYCHAGTAYNNTQFNDFTAPQPCLESMYCPEGSSHPGGVGNCPKGFYCPFAEKIPCPVGTYCPRTGHISPLPCEPGYFNLMIAQFECTKCHIGYICPSYGRVDPLICPSGYVCSKTGLSSPNIRCPAGYYCQNGTQTSNPFRNDTTFRPYPCPPGTFCLSGVGSDIIMLGNFHHAQPCTEGFFCEAGSRTAKGSGLCPPGFTCPIGTSNPIPSPKGYFAQLFGTVQAEACLPGFYAPTIQSTACYPCPPGTSCEGEGLSEAEICPPGTHRGTIEEDGQTCAPCPQGSWSKNWHLREKGECIKCPTGINCPKDGMTSPCNFKDLPQPYVPVVNLDGIPVPEFEFSSSDLPPYFSLDECLNLNPSPKDHASSETQTYFFGELIPPYVDILGRGAHLRQCDQESLKYSTYAKCFHNSSPLGTTLYRRMVDYYGPQYDIETGYHHQGYGNINLMNTMYAVSPSIDYDINAKFVHGDGVMNIDLSYSRVFDLSQNCSTGFFLMNSSLTQDSLKVVYTDANSDFEGGYDIQKCPFYDKYLDCYIDITYEIHSKGECCFVEPGLQRAIALAQDQFYSGTCEADKICQSQMPPEAEPCDDGYVCDHATTSDLSKAYPCREGYYCISGTTPDPSLAAPQGQFSRLCPTGFVCSDRTGLNNVEKMCPARYFCPTGTGNALLGAVANDAINRKISERFVNPQKQVVHMSYYGRDHFQLLSAHDIKCRSGSERSLRNRYQLERIYSHYNNKNVNVYHSKDNQLNASQFTNTQVVNEAKTFDLSCARDNKWNLIGDAIKRQECDCNGFLYTVIAVFRLWQCTATEHLDNFGIGALTKISHENGKRDLWFDRIHRDFDLTATMDESLKHDRLKWGNGPVCEWPNADILTLTKGRIPYIGEQPNDGRGGRFVNPIPDYGITAASNGLLRMLNYGTKESPNVNFFIQFTQNEEKIFFNYAQLKREVESIYTSQLGDEIDPFIFNLKKSIKLIEEYGLALEKFVSFREARKNEDMSYQVEIERYVSVSQNNTEKNTSSTIFLTPTRLDICECQNLFKCPNGTTSPMRSDDIFDCIVHEKEVLRRVSLIPSSSDKDRVQDGIDFGVLSGKKVFSIRTLELRTLETGIFTIDLRGLKNNFTYNEHYQISVYENCKPCPTNYKCKKTVGNTECIAPSIKKQTENMNICLSQNRKPVCVHASGTSIDVDWCMKQNKIFSQETYPLSHEKTKYDKKGNPMPTYITPDEKAHFYSSYLIYSEPDIQKCLSIPFFCETKEWSRLSFRKLCQDRLDDKTMGPLYDCSLVDRYNEYIKWQNEKCCVSGGKQGFCDEEACIYNSTIATKNVEHLMDEFIQERGYTPPTFHPKGEFVMNKTIQEDRLNESPLELFATLSPIPSKHYTSDTNDHLDYNNETKNIFYFENKSFGCCSCKRKKMPKYFEYQILDGGFPDNKHQLIQLSITALESVNLTVVIELLHGLYYSEFDEYFAKNDWIEIHIHSPSRFHYKPEDSEESRFSWLAMLDRKDFLQTSLELPLNLPTTTTLKTTKEFEKILINRPSHFFTNNIKYSNIRGQYNDSRIKAPYPIRDKLGDIKQDESWWGQKNNSNSQDNDFSFIALPYFPFFSNCDGYDSHLIISQLLEEHPDCNLIEWNNTKFVNQYPWAGELSPLSDSCQKIHTENSPSNEKNRKKIEQEVYKGIEIACMYEEEVENPSSGIRWYETQGGTTLFHISTEAMSPKHYESQKYLHKDIHDDIRHGWGQTPELNSIRGTHKLKPVKVSQSKGGVKNSIPRLIQLDLEYYQVSKGQKRLVHAELFFDDLCATVKPLQFGGNQEILDLAMAKGILPCDVDINGNLKSYTYDLEVHFYPLDWFHLLNRFEFDGQIYLGFFTVVGMIGIMLATLIWLINRLITKLRYPPPFHGLSLARLISEPSWLGCFLAAIPYFISMLLVFFWFGETTSFSKSKDLGSPSIFRFEDIHGNWMDNSAFEENLINKYRTGRAGVGILAIGLYLSSLCISLIVPVNDQKKSQLKEEIIDNSSNYEDTNGLTNNTNQIIRYNGSNTWIWKRAHLAWISICIQSILLCKMEFSYSSLFEENLFLYVFLFKLIQIASELIIEELLREHLMAAPLVVLVQVTKSVVTMGASDFVEFMLSHFIELSVTVLERLYLDPWLKNILHLLPRWKMMFRRTLSKKKRLTRSEKANDEAQWRIINENIELRKEGVEPLLDSYIVYSIEIVSSLLLPIAILFLMIFSNETQIPASYGIQGNEMGYYMMFAVYMIPWNVIVDVFILNTQELVYGWRLYDYLAYQRYRFTTRENRWILNSDIVDESISDAMQTLDLLCFSSQYYFLLALFAFGMMNNVFAISIFLRSEYNFLGDPMMPIIIVTTMAACDVIKIIVEAFSDVNINCLNFRGIWKTKQFEGTVDDEVAAKLSVGEGRQIDLERERLELQALNSDGFRHRFLEKNRPWVLQHLADLITPRSLKDVGPYGRPLTEYLRDVYADLIQMGEGSKNPGARSDISSDDGQDDEVEKRRQWSRTTMEGSSLSLARLWLQKARKRRSFERCIHSIIQNQKENLCSLCSRRKEQCDRLTVGLSNNGIFEPNMLDDLIRSFELIYSVNENDPNKWISFFRKKAEFMTVCNICMDQVGKNKVNANDRASGMTRLTRAGDISSDEEDDEHTFEPIVILRSSNEGKMMKKWLDASRKKLGGQFPREEANKQIMLYIDRMKRKKSNLHARLLRSENTSGQNTLQRAQNVKNEDWGKIEMDSSSNALVIRWIRAARTNLKKQFFEKGHVLREQVDNALTKISIEDDWFFGLELRKQGELLKSEGEQLLIDTRIIEANTEVDVSRIEAEKDAFRDQINFLIKKKFDACEMAIKNNNAKIGSEVELRICEMQRMMDLTREKQKEEEKRYRVENGAMSSEMIARHQNAIEEIQHSISKEKDIEEDKRSRLENESRDLFEQYKRVMIRSIFDKENEANIKIESLRTESNTKQEKLESEWRLEVAQWLHVSLKKIKIKDKEDKTAP